jgi:hypothetical protein
MADSPEPQERRFQVARRSVVLDYPSLRSSNAFRERGFVVREERPQFLLPMVLHRWTNQVGLSQVAETPGRLLGLTRWLGSPVIIRADRSAPSA